MVKIDKRDQVCFFYLSPICAFSIIKRKLISSKVLKNNPLPLQRIYINKNKSKKTNKQNKQTKNLLEHLKTFRVEYEHTGN